ncbi:hypothetical protein HPB50_019267 [Hyalomma asiaticum]|uniref:Uncharacterized protein n=1 Tax=Hyalomma asiaticum TaxID=266040 RepID=A0ACB7S2R0_HYAAI|nr:hypothetical protein HPB50_019267 [Hyalomma asiaticum]
MPFNKAMLLLVASCAAEGLGAASPSAFSVRSQIRAQLLLETAIFKKVTCLSAAGVAANPPGFVSSLLAADAWVVALFLSFLANACIGILCIPVVLAALAQEVGYEPACACLAWILAVFAVSCTIIEPLLYKSCRILYRFRDQRLKKFTDFLLSIRPIKMSALEGVFQKSLLQLRENEINQAFRVNIFEMLLETLFGASSTMMIIIAFGTLAFVYPDAVFSPAVTFSCVYMLTIMDTMSTGAPHTLRLKSSVFRSCRRLITFFKEEEHSKEEAENRHAADVAVGEVTLKDCSFAWCKREEKVHVPALDGVNLRIESGSLVGIVGPVGSGKSSLLSAIIGDMRHLSGYVSLNGSFATVSQAPQVLNMSVRDNITFGRKFEEPYYNKVLEACQLLRDISRMPAGDLTEAGDKGEMLSGGQKQRVALARAVYSRSDIYLLDDPTSSQDARVAHSIMRRVLGHGGLLENKRFFAIVRAYFKYSGACAPIALSCLAASAVFVACQLLCTKALSASMMSDTENATHARRSVTQWLAVFCIGDVILRLAGGTLLAYANRHRSMALHANMLDCVAGSALSFFDATPRGRIFNRFSVDLEMNDTRVFVFSKQYVQNIFYVFARLAVIGTQVPLVFVLTVCAEMVLLFCMRYLIRGTMSGRLYESTRLSRLLQHLTETLESVGLIRCYGVMEQFCARFRRMVTVYLESFNMFVYCFAIGRLVSTICALVIIVLTVAIIVAPAHDDPGSAAMAGLSLLSALTVPFATVMVFLGGFWDALGEAAFQRALEYTELPLEKETLTKREGSHGHTKYEMPRILVQPYDDLWPSRGVVSFESFSASYRPGIADDTLKGVSFVAEAGQKLAVVGRTGAGKSSLVLALLRMIQRTSGMITIDGINIEASR